MRPDCLRSDGLRSDAKSNRERILAAAAQAFADEGLSISLVEIARRAGVGNATLHRNFTKEQLVQELFEGWFARRQAVAEQALTDPDAWHGLVSFLEDVLVVGTRNHAIRPLFAIRPQWRERFRALIGELLQRAQQAGQARPDLTAEDVFLVMLGILRTMGITAETAPEQWRRHLAIALDGMKARNPDRLPGLSVSAAQLDGELVQWSDTVLRTGLC
ncbi:TetR family transcriptional regulator [Jatrophihabitans sp. GAS493]|nr:TetR family transcriptional regulator [Jatrophihabitans sp. GAS493]